MSPINFMLMTIARNLSSESLNACLNAVFSIPRY